MINIKIILVLPLVLLIIFYLTRLGNKTYYRLALIAISATGILFVLFPSLTNTIAHWVGVGRGADLITYLFIVFFFLGGVNLYAKIKKLESQQQELLDKFGS